MNDVNHNNINSTRSSSRYYNALTQQLVTNLSMWGRIESAAVIIAACLPSHSALFKSFKWDSLAFTSLRSIFGSSNNASKKDLSGPRSHSETEIFAGKGNKAPVTTYRGWHELQPRSWESENTPTDSERQ